MPGPGPTSWVLGGTRVSVTSLPAPCQRGCAEVELCPAHELSSRSSDRLYCLLYRSDVCSLSFVDLPRDQGLRERHTQLSIPSLRPNPVACTAFSVSHCDASRITAWTSLLLSAEGPLRGACGPPQPILDFFFPTRWLLIFTVPSDPSASVRKYADSEKRRKPRGLVGRVLPKKGPSCVAPEAGGKDTWCA